MLIRYRRIGKLNDTSMYRLTIISLMSFCLTCCSARTKSVVFTLKNTGGENIESAKIKFPNFVSIGGNLKSGVSKSHYGVEKHRPIPDFVEAFWVRSKDGKSFSKKIRIWDSVNKGKILGEFVFSFNDNKVSVAHKK